MNRSTFWGVILNLNGSLSTFHRKVEERMKERVCQGRKDTLGRKRRILQKDIKKKGNVYNTESTV